MSHMKERNIELLVSQEQLNRIKWACIQELESLRQLQAKQLKEHHEKINRGEYEGTRHLEKGEEMINGYNNLIEYFADKQDEANQELARRGQESMLKTWEKTFGGQSRNERGQ
jgi:hypothetical protein